MMPEPEYGSVTDAQGATVGGAYVHVLGADDAYLSRTITAPDGSSRAARLLRSSPPTRT